MISVVRDGQTYRYYDPTVSQLQRGDKLIVDPARPRTPVGSTARRGTDGGSTPPPLNSAPRYSPVHLG